MYKNALRLGVMILSLFLTMQSVAADNPVNSSVKSKNQWLWNAYLQPTQNWPERAEHAKEDLQPLPPAKSSLENPKAKLGKKLFHDPNLSADGTVSCASCHKASQHRGDERTVSEGVGQAKGRRNAPMLMNVDLWQSFFWDGRAATLQEQALGPLTDPVEMAHTAEEVVSYLKQNEDYASLWQQAYSNAPKTWNNVADALAIYQQTFRSPANPLDSFIKAVDVGDKKTAKEQLNTQQLLGLHLYRTKAGCINCHNGALLSDNRFHNTGLHYFGRRFEDLGRYEVTGNEEDMGRFRTPSLRHVMETKPWMHNGLFTQMEGIIRLYEHGGARPKRPKSLAPEKAYPVTSNLLTPFELSDEEREALMEFLDIL